MSADPLYVALHPFHQWAQIAVVCAFVLAAGAFAVLGVSRRLSRRWWVGLGVLALCLLAVVFGARSRGASYDLLPFAILAVGYGAFQTANSVVQWIEMAYLADITRAGDGLGQLPLIEAIMGTIFGSVVLVMGLALVIFCTGPRCERPVAQ